MPGILLHGGDLSGAAWLFILVVFALAGLVALASFVGILYVVGKHWRPFQKAAATSTDSRVTERMTND